MEKLYENIRAYRKERGMSQEKLAKLTGYTDRSSIAKIEKGVVDLQQSKIMLFARALDVPVLDLLGWTESPEPHQTVKYTLTDIEVEIIRKYRALDASDRIRAEERISTLLDDEKYQKEGLSNARKIS